LIMMVLLGFTGSVVPIGDSLAVFRRELAIICALFGVVALGFGKFRISVLAFIVSIGAGVSLVPWMKKTDEITPTFSLRQHNVFFGNTDLSALFEFANNSGADILTFQEVGTKSKPHIALTQEKYPHYQQCFYGQGGVAVMAKDLGPLVGHGCTEKGKLAWIRLHTKVGPVTFASIHQLWPWPSGQYWQSARLASELRNIPRPIIVAGDFNMVPWSATTQLLAEAVGGEIATGLDPTFEIANGFLKLRIDNVIAPKGSRLGVSTTEKLGSDHAALWAEIELMPETDNGGAEKQTTLSALEPN